MKYLNTKIQNGMSKINFTEDQIRRDPDIRKKILTQAIIQWGPKSQEDMVVEECAELLKALMKFRRSNSLSAKKCLLEMADEIADVEIMLEQLKIMHELHENVESIKVFKLKRLIERLNS